MIIKLWTEVERERAWNKNYPADKNFIFRP